MTTEAEDTDDHGFLGCRLLLRQFRDGHRAGTDACLLAAALDIQAGEHVVDAGAGVGAAGLAVLARAPDATVTLVERDRGSCTLARHNILVNRMTERARIVEVDLFDVDMLRDAGLYGCAETVITNPPFYQAGTLRPSPSARRRHAHIMDRGNHADWLRNVAALVAPRGRLAVIHRPEVLPVLLSALSARWGDFSLRPILTRPDRPATRIILGAREGSRAPLTILPDFCVSATEGGLTAEADALHRGVGPSLLSKRPA